MIDLSDEKLAVLNAISGKTKVLAERKHLNELVRDGYVTRHMINPVTYHLGLTDKARAALAAVGEKK